MSKGSLKRVIHYGVTITPPFHIANIRRGSVGINRVPVADLLDVNNNLVYSASLQEIINVSEERKYRVVNMFEAADNAARLP